MAKKKNYPHLGQAFSDNLQAACAAEGILTFTAHAGLSVGVIRRALREGAQTRLTSTTISTLAQALRGQTPAPPPPPKTFQVPCACGRVTTVVML